MFGIYYDPTFVKSQVKSGKKRRNYTGIGEPSLFTGSRRIRPAGLKLRNRSGNPLPDKEFAPTAEQLHNPGTFFPKKIHSTLLT